MPSMGSAETMLKRKPAMSRISDEETPRWEAAADATETVAARTHVAQTVLQLRELLGGVLDGDVVAVLSDAGAHVLVDLVHRRERLRSRDLSQVREEE